MKKTIFETQTCKVEGCEAIGSTQIEGRPANLTRIILGYCYMHYCRLRKAGVQMDRPHRDAKVTCKHTGCNKPRYCQDYCETHYQRSFHGLSLDLPLKRNPSQADLRDRLGRKYCKWCNEWLAEAHFSLNAKRIDGLEYQCAECRVRGSRMPGLPGASINHKVGKQRYEAMIAAGCEVCGRLDNLAVDHDHGCCPGMFSCGLCVRGCLCRPCNSALGFMGDDPDRISALLDYLARTITHAG